MFIFSLQNSLKTMFIVFILYTREWMNGLGHVIHMFIYVIYNLFIEIYIFEIFLVLKIRALKLSYIP